MKLGGGLPIFIKCLNIFVVSSGSGIIAIISTSSNSNHYFIRCIAIFSPHFGHHLFIAYNWTSTKLRTPADQHHIPFRLCRIPIVFIKRCILINLAQVDRCSFVPAALSISFTADSTKVVSICFFSFQPFGANLTRCSCSSHFPRLRDAYSGAV